MGAVEEMMCVACVSVSEGHSGDRCNLALTFYKYDLRKGDLFVLSWGKGATSEAGKYLFRASNVWCSILLLPLVARCIETIDICIWHMFVFMPVVTVWESVGMFVVWRPLLKIVF